MKRHSIRRGLRWGVAATVLLPIALVLVIGLGGLLAAVGDAAGARGCGRMALVLGVVWVTAVAGTTLATAIAVLAEPGRPPRRRRRHRRRRPGRGGPMPPPAPAGLPVAPVPDRMS